MNQQDKLSKETKIVLGLSALWASILLSLGFSRIEPMIFRFLLFPVLGLPLSAYSLWEEITKEGKKFSFFSFENIIGVLILSPCCSGFVAIISIFILDMALALALSILGIDGFSLLSWWLDG